MSPVLGDSDGQKLASSEAGVHPRTPLATEDSPKRPRATMAVIVGCQAAMRRRSNITNVAKEMAGEIG
jgi:hypothetical protein